MHKYGNKEHGHKQGYAEPCDTGSASLGLFPKCLKVIASFRVSFNTTSSFLACFPQMYSTSGKLSMMCIAFH